MRVYTVVLLVAAIIFVECDNIFIGTNLMRPLVYHKEARYGLKMFQKRVEYLNYTIPAIGGYARSIQGILAFDLTHSGASVNITRGGIGYNFVNIRIKSDSAKELHYDVLIYA